MKLTISIKIFQALDQIRKEHGVKNKDWSRASGLAQTRISELRRLLKHYYMGHNVAIGRNFSLAKLMRLTRGLYDLIGPDLRKALIKKAEGVEDQTERLILLTLALSDAQKNLLESFLKGLYSTD